MLYAVITVKATQVIAMVVLVACAFLLTACSAFSPAPSFPPPPSPGSPEGATVEVGGGLELLVPGTPYEALRQEFGEPAIYEETWEEGPLATSNEVTWLALFIVKEFDHWEIYVFGSESEGLTSAHGGWADRREPFEDWTPPPGQPLEAGSVADPLRQLGMLMQPEEVTELLGEPVNTTIRNGRPKQMQFRFLNVCWELFVQYEDLQVQHTGNNAIDEYGVSGWHLSWEPCW